MLTYDLALSANQFLRKKKFLGEYEFVHSVRSEATKLIFLVRTRITYQATGDAVARTTDVVLLSATAMTCCSINCITASMLVRRRTRKALTLQHRGRKKP